MFPSHSSSGSKINYSSADYWDDRYGKEEHFEWLDQGYDAMLHLIKKEIPDKSSRILMLGCGSSRLSSDLYSHGFHYIVNTDISKVCIRNQSLKHQGKTGLEWKVMDMTQITEPDESFDIVIEKTTLDSLLAGERSQWNVRQETRKKIEDTLCHISRVLKTGGIFLSLTFAQPHFRYKICRALFPPACSKIRFFPGRLPFYAEPKYSWSVLFCVINPEASFHFYSYRLVKGEELDDNYVRQYTRISPQIVGDEDCEMSDDGDQDYFGNLDVSL